MKNIKKLIAIRNKLETALFFPSWLEAYYVVQSAT